MLTTSNRDGKVVILKKNNNKVMSILTEFTQDELEAVIEENSSLRGYLQGYLAEVALKRSLLKLPDVTAVTKIRDQNTEKGDLKVTFKGVDIVIEVKSIAGNSVRDDVLNDTWEGVVRLKNSDKREVTLDGVGTITTSNLIRGQFDILAVSCYAVSGTWDFVFIENEYLPVCGSDKPNMLKGYFTVNPEITPCLKLDATAVLNSVLEKKLAATVKIET